MNQGTNPVTFSQKLYQANAITFTEQEKINNLLDEIAELVAQPSEVINSYLINKMANDWMLIQQIKCVTPLTYSQKLYQSNAINSTAQEIIKQYSKQVTPETLQEVRNLLEEIFQLAD